MKNNKITLSTFITLIIAIIVLLIYNIIQNNKLNNVDRKIEYIFNNYTYDRVYINGSNLFFKAIELLNNNEIFIFEKDDNNIIKNYVINDEKEYKKINNFNIVSNILSDHEIKKYMNLNGIIKYENNYYIVSSEKEKINNKYIGSILDIYSYDDKYVYFKSINYYCENYEYIGLLDDIPNCKYTSDETKFTLILENNNLRISNLEEIRSILK